MARGSPFVDYERHAAVYHQGRALPEEVMARWGEAVRRRLPPTTGGPLRVLDLGAGTGIIARAWPGWAPVALVALDPAEAMIDQGKSAAPYVQGVAERLPFRSKSLDVVWLSAVVHHFSDPAGAAAEMGRVLRPGGKVLIRGLLRGRSRIGSLEAFSAAAQAKVSARFPDLDQLSTWFSTEALDLEDVHNVRDNGGNFAELAQWVEQMRHSDTMLTALDDAEIDAGLEVMRLEPDRQVHSELTLVTFVRR